MGIGGPRIERNGVAEQSFDAVGKDPIVGERMVKHSC